MIPPTRFLVIPPVISGLVVGSASWIFFYSIGVPGRPALSAFAVGLLIGFTLGMSYWTNRVVGYSREQPQRQYNLDYDNPDFIETHYTGGGMEGHYVPLPITKNQLRLVANLIVQGASFSHATLAGPGKPLTRSEYEALRTRLEQRGWIAPRNRSSPNQGYVIIGRGMEQFERIADSTSLTWGRGSALIHNPAVSTRTHTREEEDEWTS